MGGGGGAGGEYSSYLILISLPQFLRYGSNRIWIYVGSKYITNST